LIEWLLRQNHVVPALLRAYFAILKPRMRVISSLDFRRRRMAGHCGW